MKPGIKSMATAALAVAVLIAGGLSEADAFTYNCRAIYDHCEQDCQMFTDMAKNNAGTEEGHQQALVAGACLARCKAKEFSCKLRQKAKKKFCLGKSCD